MSWIAIPGVLVLLAAAWWLSVERSSIRLRPVIWGLLLQVILAIAVLRRDVWSFVGMAVLGLLVVAFLIERATPEGSLRLSTRALVLAGAVVLGAVLASLPPAFTASLFLALALFNWIFGKRLHATIRCGIGALIAIASIGWLAAAGVSGRELFQRIGVAITELLTLADYGSRFLFGNLVDESLYFPAADAGWPGFGYLFAFKLLPIIVFFGGLTAVLYYLGWMQRSIEALSKFLRWTTGTSGAETLCASANIFIGQTEAPLLIRPFIERSTRSELVTLMVAGFATLSGGSIAAYAAMGIPVEHLVAASAMSAPAALVVAKIIHPEVGLPETSGDVDLPRLDSGSNVLEAASRGISDGLRLAVNVGAMLIGFIALVALADWALNSIDRWIDGRWLAGLRPGWGEPVTYPESGMSPATSEYRGIFPGSLQTLFGTLLAPVAWLIGIPAAETQTVGGLLGLKLSLNEFVAYSVLRHQAEAGALSERTIALSTYALCGFANFGSVGIQIGGFGALAPSRRAELSRFCTRAMLGGALASLMTAAIASLFLT